MLELEPFFHLPDSCFSYSPSEHFHISNQVFRLGMEEESSNETNIGGHVEPLATMLGVSFARNHARERFQPLYIMLMGFFKNSLPIGFDLA